MDPLRDTVFVSSVNLGANCIQVYDISNGSCIKTFRGICSAPRTLCQVGTDEYIICGQKDKPLLQAWALNKNETLEMRFRSPGKVNVIAVNNTFNKLCAMGIGESIHLIHMNTGLPFGVITRHYQDVTCLKFTSCGNYLASGGEDGFVYLWSKFKLIESLHKDDKPQIEPHYILGQHSDKVTGICISEPGMRGILISTSMDHTAKIYDLVSGNLRHNIIPNCGLTACTINAIGSQTFFAGEKGRVWGVNLLPQKFDQNLQLEGKGAPCHESQIHHIGLNSAGDTLVTGGADGDVKVWTIILHAKKNVFSTPSFALQRTLLSGRGAITNLLVWKLDAEIFNVSSLNLGFILSPFKDANNILDSKMLYPVRRKPRSTDPNEFINMAAKLLRNEQNSNSVNSSSNNKANSKRRKLDEECIEEAVPSECQSNGYTNLDMLARVENLATSNENLFKLCLKHILQE